MKKNQGFTLIELLVVIAIIGILASVVLASLNTARAKGADASVKSNLNNMRAQAELVYDNASPNSYATVCANGNITKALAAAQSAAGVTTGACNSPVGGATWTAWVPLKSTTTSAWCVDNTGTSKLLTALPTAAITVCP